MLWNLFTAEWLKITKRPLAWAMLVIFLGLMLLYLTLWFLLVALHEGTFSGGITRFQALGPEQIAEIKRQLSFPGIFGSVLGQVNATGGICAIILAAGALGSDFGWGTLRVLLTRAPRRGLYLTAKLLALMLALLTGILIALVIGSLLAMVYGAILHLPQQIGARDLLLLPVGIARALYVILPYVLITFTAAAFGRSVLAGAGGGLIFLALDVSAGSLSTLGLVDQLIQFIVNLLLQPNINTLVVLNSQLYGLDQTVLASSLNLEVLPSPLQAMIVIAVYCGFFFWSSYRLLAGRDIGGAT